MALNDLGIPTRISKEEQFFFLNADQVSGVQSVDINYTNNNNPLKYIGMKGNVTGVPRGAQIGNVNLSVIPIGNDYFLNLTGNTGFNGYIIRDKSNPLGDNYSFTSGYLTSYNSRASIGSIPTIEVGINIVGNIGKFNLSESSVVSGNFLSISGDNGQTYPFQIVAPGYLTVNLDDYNTNRLISYDLSINVQRQPLYVVGKRIPNEMKTALPIEVSLNFQLETDAYTGRNLQNFPCVKNNKNITITLQDYNTNNNFITYSFNDMELIGEDYSVNVDGAVQSTLRYRKFLM